MLINSINKSINQIDALLDGWTFGRLVIDVATNGKLIACLQKEDGEMIPIPTHTMLEVRNGDQWLRLTRMDLYRKTVEGWPAYAGLEARMR